MSAGTLAPQIPDAPGTLADVLPLAAGLLGVGDVQRDLLPPGERWESEAVTVLLVDGLGWWPWRQQADLTPTMASLGATTLNSTVPSTTPTALASLGTGLETGEHGIMGAAFWIPEDEVMLHPLTWGSDPHPLAVQPEQTVFEKVAAAGLPVRRIGAAAYGGSGLTRAVLRGGEYLPAETHDDIVEGVAGHRQGLGYAYVPDLDRIGHVHGTDSPEWRQCLEGIDALVGRILERIGPSHRLLVTADHGMVDCSDSARVPMESLPSFDDVIGVGGEPRLRHVYVDDAAVLGVAREWEDVLGDRAWVLTRDEFLAGGLLGRVDPAYAGRVGDIVVLARGETVLASAVDPLVSGLRGQHGSVTDAEVSIPLLAATGHGHG